MTGKTWSDLVDCDVANLEKLALFRSKLRELREILTGDDIHSIKSQFSALQWNDQIYRCYKEAIALKLEKGEGTEFEQSLFFLFEQTYIQSLMISIRKLVDNNDRNPNRTVYSLERVLDEIEENKELFTREHYVCYDGKKYNPKDNAIVGWRTERECEISHFDFDRLSGTTKETRNREDTILPEVLSGLRRRLSRFELIKTIGNKFVFHPADPENRRTVEPKLEKLDEAEFDKATEDLIAAISGLALILDDLVLTEAPAVMFDQFLNWDQPLVDNPTIHKKLETNWLERSNFYGSLTRIHRESSGAPWKIPQS